jgi:hypothetical protein
MPAVPSNTPINYGPTAGIGRLMADIGRIQKTQSTQLKLFNNEFVRRPVSGTDSIITTPKFSHLHSSTHIIEGVKWYVKVYTSKTPDSWRECRFTLAHPSMLDLTDETWLVSCGCRMSINACGLIC